MHFISSSFVRLLKCHSIFVWALQNKYNEREIGFVLTATVLVAVLAEMLRRVDW